MTFKRLGQLATGPLVAQAALQDRDLDGNGMTDALYDTDLDITWLRDANVNGSMTWDTALSWAGRFGFGGHGSVPSTNPSRAQRGASLQTAATRATPTRTIRRLPWLCLTVMWPPVPEPETWALMLAGLAAVGAMGDRLNA